MRVLVTGGAGYIGSVVVEKLLAEGHTTVVYDNLSRGHSESVADDAKFVCGDVSDGNSLGRVLAGNSIEAVIHLAAESLVGESFRNPAKYYRENLTGGLTMLEAMRAQGVLRIVFSSSAAVYGEPATQPISESEATIPTNPYGETKLAFERALQWYRQAYGMKYISLRYYNAAGATVRCGELHDPETHLIPIVLEVAAGLRPFVEIFGTDYPTRDGTCIRDYIHVSDLARAHVLALSRIDEASGFYNLGCGGGYTVLEVIETARRVTGRDIPIRTAARRAGDPSVLIASSDKVKTELGWAPEKQDLDTIIQSAWSWMRARTMTT